MIILWNHATKFGYDIGKKVIVEQWRWKGGAPVIQLFMYMLEL